jgi:hypothetical protein
MVEVLEAAPVVAARAKVSSDLIALAVFCGLGLLLSLAVLILDQQFPGEWF